VIFGEAQPPSEAMDQGSVEELGASTPQKQVQRGAKYWAEHGAKMLRAAPRRAEEPPGDPRGKEAVHGWVAACHSCTLTEVRQQRCSHAETERVRAPIMLLETEAAQFTSVFTRRTLYIFVGSIWASTAGRRGPYWGRRACSSS
jgi:hypothetical protein